jgi:hypothetical protein
MVAPTWITPGCAQFLENRKRFHTAWTQSGTARQSIHFELSIQTVLDAIALQVPKPYGS